MIRRTIILVALLAFASATPHAAAQTSIVNSKHNLSASGPGSIRSTNEQQVCIFCHTPHNAAPVQPLWNRNLPTNAYVPYSSSSLQARPGQPTGISKLCLSCHDGTIALGSVLSANQQIFMAGGMTTLPPGHPANLGTDLSDDHPISFKFDDALIGKDPKLKSPMGLPPNIKLDGNGELQCTTCHDPHDNTFGKFLVMENANSQLCNSCHNPGQTDIAGHMNCASCHQPHTAPSGAHLLAGTTVKDTCVRCHSGATARASNIAADLNKVSQHDTSTAMSTEQATGPNLVTCSSCHDSHTMLGQAQASAPLISPKLGTIAGVGAGGSPTPRAQFEYEVCFKCHAEQGANIPPLISRQIIQNNTRLEFDPSAVSFHPVEAPGKNTNVPSLRTGWTTSSIVRCTDCHASDTSAAAGGGTGASGPHGSAFRPLLVAAYETTDGTAESANAYALCYRCHNRSSIISETGPFRYHKKHVLDARTPCSVCHDAHGIASGQGNATNNSHLINFDTSVVKPDPVTRRMEYISSSGECYLTCHNKPHSPKGGSH